MTKQSFTKLQNYKTYQNYIASATYTIYGNIYNWLRGYIINKIIEFN